MSAGIPRCACGTQKWIRGQGAAMEAVFRDQDSANDPFATSDVRSSLDDGLSVEWRCLACGALGPQARVQAAFQALRRER